MSDTKNPLEPNGEDLELVLISHENNENKVLDESAFEEDLSMTLEDCEYIASRTDYKDIEKLSNTELDVLGNDTDLIVVGEPPEIIKP